MLCLSGFELFSRWVPLLFCCVIYTFFNVLSGYFYVSIKLMAVLTVLILLKFVTQLLHLIFSNSYLDTRHS